MWGWEGVRACARARACVCVCVSCVWCVFAHSNNVLHAQIDSLFLQNYLEQWNTGRNSGNNNGITHIYITNTLGRH